MWARSPIWYARAWLPRVASNGRKTSPLTRGRRERAARDLLVRLASRAAPGLESIAAFATVPNRSKIRRDYLVAIQYAGASRWEMDDVQVSTKFAGC